MKHVTTCTAVHGTSVRLAFTVACLGLAATTFTARDAAADAVTDWNAVITTAVATAAPAERPAFGLQHALVHVAIYDAVNAIDGSYKVFAIRPDTRARGASKDAAAVSAAYQVLAAVFPSLNADGGLLKTTYANSLAAIPDGDAKTRGIAIGAEVAAKWLVKRANDGRMAPVTYAFGPPDPGVFQMYPGWPAPGGVPISPITPWQAKVTPFVLKSPSQFRGDGPPDLGSAEYAADFNETKRMGVSGAPATVRSAAQTELGLFHTMNPNLFWGTNLNKFVKDQGLSLTENSRLMARLYVTIGDAAIACWDSKYTFNRWRPVTAIRYAEDGNAATTSDPNWLPQVPTPPHPEYPAAHGCISGSVMEALRQYYGTKNLHLSFFSTTTNTTRTYEHTEDFLEDVEDARVFGGMHFRTSVEDGEALGKRVARAVAKSAFQRADSWDWWSR